MLDGCSVILIDFGIAHFPDSSKTQHGAWLGNKGYAAPEQLVKGSKYEVNEFADVYALGEIIHEVFTGEKPAGTNYELISTKNPLLSPVDDLVNRCLAFVPDNRPQIEEIMSRMELLRCQLTQERDSILNEIWPVTGTKEKTEEDILDIAAEDIQIAHKLLSQPNPIEGFQVNERYHEEIRYFVDEKLENLLFQVELLKACRSKFLYESGDELTGPGYLGLDMTCDAHKAIFEQLCSRLEKASVEIQYKQITNEIRKTFISCADYHCNEVLCAIEPLIKFSKLSGSPIIPILEKVSLLRNSGICDIVLENYLSVLLSESDIPDKKQRLLLEDEKRKIRKSNFRRLSQEWKVRGYFLSDGSYVSFFDSRSLYENFKKYAWEHAKADYIYEGDVLDLLRVNNFYDNMVELRPWDDFLIDSVLPRVLNEGKEIVEKAGVEEE